MLYELEIDGVIMHHSNMLGPLKGLAHTRGGNWAIFTRKNSKANCFISNFRDDPKKQISFENMSLSEKKSKVRKKRRRQAETPYG